MKCDQRGNVWVTAPGGVWVYAASGDLLGKVRVPEMVPSELGRRRLPDAVPNRDALGLHRHDQGWAPQRALYDREGRRSRRGVFRARAAAPRRRLQLDPKRCALIIQDLQNDVIMEGGAFAESGAPAHAHAQRVVDNVRRLADAARARGVVVIHVWFIVEPGAPGVTLNAPLFEGLVDSRALVRGSWGAAPVRGSSLVRATLSWKRCA